MKNPIYLVTLDSGRVLGSKKVLLKKILAYIEEAVISYKSDLVFVLGVPNKLIKPDFFNSLNPLIHSRHKIQIKAFLSPGALNFSLKSTTGNFSHVKPILEKLKKKGEFFKVMIIDLSWDPAFPLSHLRIMSFSASLLNYNYGDYSLYIYSVGFPYNVAKNNYGNLNICSGLPERVYVRWDKFPAVPPIVRSKFYTEGNLSL